MQAISPFLWFDHQAESAAKFYTSVFKGSKILSVMRNQPGVTGNASKVLTVKFRLQKLEFVALNGGPLYKFNPAVSFVVNCRNQREVDYYWRKLSAGGKKIQCGWLTDKYGLSWQIVPDALLKLLGSKDNAKAERVMKVMMKMVKLDIKALQRAAAKK
jgi:predicted 3-demethylubiquinone-9 3-methyltransferase (glyoxalase superfamily)